MSYNLKYCSFIRIILMRLPCRNHSNGDVTAFFVLFTKARSDVVAIGALCSTLQSLYLFVNKQQRITAS